MATLTARASKRDLRKILISRCLNKYLHCFGFHIYIYIYIYVEVHIAIVQYAPETLSYYLLPTTYNLLPTTYNLLPTTYYLLPIKAESIRVELTCPRALQASTPWSRWFSELRPVSSVPPQTLLGLRWSTKRLPRPRTEIKKRSHMDSLSDGMGLNPELTSRSCERDRPCEVRRRLWQLS